MQVQEESRRAQRVSGGGDEMNDSQRRTDGSSVFPPSLFPASIHPSSSITRDPSTKPRLFLRSASSFVCCPFIICAFSLGVQAWLTEIHEYAQQDVVVMLLGNKVRPRCQRVERPADRWTHGGREEGVLEGEGEC